MRIAYKNLVSKSEGNKPLGRSRHRCEDNIKLDIKEIRFKRYSSESGWAQVHTVMKLEV
jgi:hypothetical protein